MRDPIITMTMPLVLVVACLLAACDDGQQGQATTSPAADDTASAQQEHVRHEAQEVGAPEAPETPQPGAQEGHTEHEHDGHQGHESATAEGDGQAIPSDARMITLTATDYDFEPDRITVAAGETVVLTLVNQGDDRHAVEIHLDGSERASAVIGPGEETSIVFDAPQKAGSYSIYCPVGPHRSRGMTAVLAVAERPAD